MMTPRILIVDDENELVDMIKMRLEANNFEVLTAADGEEGLKKAEEKPDLILLDLMMPVMDGYETLERLKAAEATKNIPVIMFTARGELDAVEKCYDRGVVDYIAKPFNPAALVEKIKKLLP